MQIQKKTLLKIIIVFLLLLSGIIIYYFFIHNSNIEIEDRSNYYDISYQDTKAFSDYLQRTGAWEENHATLLGLNNLFTLKKIKVILSDDNKGIYSEVDKNNTIISNTAINGDENQGVIIISIYISPSEKNNGSDRLSKNALFQILTAIRTVTTTKKITTQDVLNIAGKDIRSLNNNQPFIITAQNHK